VLGDNVYAGDKGSRGMGVPGKAGTTGGSVGVGGDVHPPAVWNKDRGGRSSFGWGPGFSAPRPRGSGAEKGGRIKYGEYVLGAGGKMGGRYRIPEGAERPEGPARGHGCGGRASPVLEEA
jgi:hypothetical protein